MAINEKKLVELLTIIGNRLDVLEERIGLSGPVLASTAEESKPKDDLENFRKKLGGRNFDTDS